MEKVSDAFIASYSILAYWKMSQEPAEKNISCVQITDDFIKAILTFNKGSDLPFFPKMFEFFNLACTVHD